jgi:hypothetical protein
MEPEYKVEISPLVSQRIGSLLQNRLVVADVLNRLRYDLENHAQMFRNLRDPEDQDNFFYAISVFSNGKWRHLHFTVNDTRATGCLFVDEVS